MPHLLLSINDRSSSKCREPIEHLRTVILPQSRVGYPWDSEGGSHGRTLLEAAAGRCVIGLRSKGDGVAYAHVI